MDIDGNLNDWSTHCLIDGHCLTGFSIVPRLYYIPESEFNDDLTTAGSLVTLKDLSYKFDAMIEEVPFQWAQALHLITRLTSKCIHKILSCER